MSVHTKGPASITKPPSGDPWVMVLRVVSESTAIDICDLRCDAEDDDAVAATHADANLIADTINVATETGKTPRQLAEERDAALAALRQCVMRLARVDGGDSIVIAKALDCLPGFDFEAAIAEEDAKAEGRT